MFLKSLALCGLISSTFAYGFLPDANDPLPDLPEAVSNNAVAAVDTEKGTYLLSFMGLAKGKSYRDVHDKTWVLAPGASEWQPGKPVPSSLSLAGRLASVAVGLNGQAYLFGGYTVAEDHSEISSPDNFRYDPVADQFQAIAPMPVPVDDAVALVYQQRYIYLVSGWHNDGNVNLVQVYDAKLDRWTQASPFLGAPVFGQAGGIVGNKLVICDGVAVHAHADKRRSFAAETACYLGTIDPKQPSKIDWRTLPHPTGKARYRMAATGLADGQKIVFAGGSDNPYNYNGIGYDGQPSEPDPMLWIFDLNKFTWSVTPSDSNTMDHRGLLAYKGQLWVIGGMGPKQTVLSQVTSIQAK